MIFWIQSLIETRKLSVAHNALKQACNLEIELL
jgi:hypothetical protein